MCMTFFIQQLMSLDSRETHKCCIICSSGAWVFMRVGKKAFHYSKRLLAQMGGLRIIIKNILLVNISCTHVSCGPLCNRETDGKLGHCV